MIVTHEKSNNPRDAHRANGSSCVCHNSTSDLAGAHLAGSRPMSDKAGYVASRWITLPDGRRTVVSESDYASVYRYRWYINNSGYVATKVGDKHIFLHRLVAAGDVVDHADGDRLNNTRENLRPCTQAQNRANSAKRRGPRITSRYKGVSFRPKNRRRPWRAFISTVELGCYATEAEAARAYDRAAIERWGEFARTNFPR